MHALVKDHWLIVKHILCYIHGTSHFGLSLITYSNLLLHGLSSWKSSKQKMVIWPSMKVEYCYY